MMRQIWVLLAFLLFIPAFHDDSQQIEVIAETQVESVTGTAYGLAWSPDGQILAVSAGAEVVFYDRALEEVLFRWAVKTGALSAGWSPDGEQIAVVSGFRNHNILVGDWDAENHTIGDTITLRGSSAQDQYLVSWSPDGAQLATLANDQVATIQFWDTNTGKPTTRVDLPYTVPLRALVWDEESSTLTGAGMLNDTGLVLFSTDPINGSDTQRLTLPETETVFDLSRDGLLLAMATQAGTMTVLDMVAETTLLQLESEIEEPVALAWTPEGDELAMLGYHGALKIWDTAALLSKESPA